MANPSLAPYGEAARETLSALGLLARLEDFRLLPIFVVGALVLAACGGGEIGGDESEAPESQGTGSSEAAAPSAAAFPEGDVEIELWTKEGDPQIAYVEALAEAYTAEHANVTINVVNKDVEVLREDLVNTALAPESAPELVWTVADHVGPFTSAGVIQELDGQVDTAGYEEGALSAVQVDGTTWGIPISNGNQLMLYYNKSLVGDAAPADTDELIAFATENTGDGSFGLVFNETESFWLTPWLAGFGTSVFEDDGTTPNLDTPEMQAALEFAARHRLGQVIIGSLFYGHDGVIDCGISGHDQYDNRRIMFFNGFQGFDAIHPGHVHIQNHHIESIGFDLLQSINAIEGFFDFKLTDIFQKRLYRES